MVGRAPTNVARMYSRLMVAASFYKPEFWLEKAGGAVLWVVAAIIFAESGLLIGFFLPGDSLLFLTGFLQSDAGRTFAMDPANASLGLQNVVNHFPPLPVLLLVVFIAAFLGDQVGYAFGRKAGPALFTRPDSRLFRQSNVTKAHDFLERHGPKTIFLARFVPIVRTFAPIVAGVGKMRYRTFVIYNLVGALCWAVGITVLGSLLGTVGFIRDNIDIAIIAVILLSLTPVFIEVIRHRRNAGARGRQPAHAADSDS